MKTFQNKILSVRNLSLHFDVKESHFKRVKHNVLNKINFDLCRGEVIGVLGRNGCGKSSLLKIIAGIIGPSDGEIIKKSSVKIALLTLGLGFRLDLSGRDNSIISLMLQGLKKEDAIKLAEEIRIFSELGKFFEHPVKTYSNGMRSRLGFSAALYNQADILLVDEVLSVGDGLFKAKARAAIIEQMKGERSVIFVSHNLSEVLEICDKAIWIEKGTIKEMGDAPDVVGSYENSLMRQEPKSVKSKISQS